MFNTVEFKRGDTFLLHGVVRMPHATDKNRDGSPKMEEADIADWGIRSEVRLGDRLIAEMVVEKRPDASMGAYTLSCADTTEWPVSKILAFDVEYTLPSGQIISTETIAINCKKDITR